MPKHGHIRHGSLQFYPRKRARKILPRVRWSSLSRENVGLLGFVCYKVGMKSAYVRDNTAHSMTKGQRITIPVTILECPPMKILSVRFYKDGRVKTEILTTNLDKELKRKIKLPKDYQKKLEDFLEKNDEFEDVRIIAYTEVKKTGIKKTPDIVELGINGTLQEKIEFIKTHLNSEITLKDFLGEDILKNGVVDVRGVTKGKGTQGPTKRFGITLKPVKTEKGRRGPGSGGPWHPARVEFRQPMAGQMGFFTRTLYNNKIIFFADINERNINPGEGFRHYGIIRTSYLIVGGSVQGPAKRQLLITTPLRPSKKQIKKNYEFIELR